MRNNSNQSDFIHRYAFNFITCFSLASLIVFMMTACEETEKMANPDIRLTDEQGYISHDTSLVPGSKMKFSIKALGDNEVNLTNYLISLHTDSISTAFDTGINTPQLEWKGQFIKGFSPEEKWEFIIRDRYGNESSTELLILADSGSSFKPLRVYTNIVFGAQNNDQTGGFFSFDTEETYMHTAATNDVELQKIIDLIYFYVEGDENTIASPGANMDAGIFPGNLEDWEIRNTTRFIKSNLDAQDFEVFVNDSILIADYVVGEGKRKSKNLNPNDIYLFKTQSERLGMFMVNEVTGTDKGTISIEIKIQEVEE